PAPPPLPTGPLVSPRAGGSQLLTDVGVTHEPCVDRVAFTFTAKNADPPTYRIEYKPGPFTQDGSGAPVAVAGTAFLSVRFEPAHGFDFEAGTPSYKGPKRLPGAGAHHVTEVVETGAFEGVVNWVIGLNAQRPVSVEATITPQHQLVVTIY